MNVRPLFDRILLKRVESETRSKGGLFLPDSAQEKPTEGIVLAVGHGRLLEDGSLVALDVRVGERVMFRPYAGTEIKVGGEDRIILAEKDILGVVEA